MATKQVGRSTKTITCKKLYVSIKSGNSTFDNEVQRALVWNNQQKSLLIHSIICDYAIPPLYAVKNGSSFDFIDGKQRSYAIFDYMDDKYALRNIPTVIDADNMEYDLNGVKYSQLPEEYKMAISDYNLTINLFDQIDQDEIQEIFYRLNNGTSLKSTDKNFARAISKAEIVKLSNHPLFEKILTPNALGKYAQRTIVIQSLIMLKEENPCLDSKEIAPFLSTTELNDADVIRLTAIYDKFVELYDELSSNIKSNRHVIRKTFSRGGIPTFTPFIEEHIDETDKLVSFLKYFFSGAKGASIRDDYSLASSQGAGHQINVEKRQQILREEWNKFEE